VYIVHRYRAKINRVIDGDTVDLNVDLGFYVNINIRARLTGVDTPERGHEDFLKAKAALENLLQDSLDSEGYIVINTGKTGKYGRWLVTIDNVNDTLAKVWPYE